MKMFLTKNCLNGIFAAFSSSSSSSLLHYAAVRVYIRCHTVSNKTIFYDMKRCHPMKTKIIPLEFLHLNHPRVAAVQLSCGDF